MEKATSAAWRRVAYFVIAGLIAVAVALGLITEAQYESWVSVLERLFPLLGTIALSVAGAKTHKGSDDPTTREDVDLAYQRAAPLTGQVPDSHPTPELEPAQGSLFDQATEHVGNAIDAARDAYREATRRN